LPHLPVTWGAVTYGLRMALPVIVFGSFFVLLLLAMVLVVANAVRRSKRGKASIQQHGWTRLPDGEDVVAGWQGWPFARAKEPGKARDVVAGEHQGVRFMSLRWSQLEGNPEGVANSGDRERYSIVALAVEHRYPPLSVIRGDRRIHPGREPAGSVAFETGDERFDRRWQTVGDAEFGRAVLTPDVRALVDAHDFGWAFQPGWVTRVTPWRHYSGEDGVLEELNLVAALLRAVPAEVWHRHGGAPSVGQLGHLEQG
jgi:hypothetical protein